ncbi:hypothetical protein N7467_007758 [Penicillium canescens]|nr:hypothetical protein N7467_007758 [Penicillium canescens]
MGGQSQVIQRAGRKERTDDIIEPSTRPKPKEKVTFYALSLIGCAEQGTLLGAHGWPLAADSQARNPDASCCRSAVAQSKVSTAAQQLDLSATWCLDRIHMQGSRITSRPNAQSSESCCAQLPARSARIRRPLYYTMISTLKPKPAAETWCRSLRRTFRGRT